ncbi:MAG: hypothetical protein ACI3VB_09840 [Oscillospiraceae bacterium]
MKKTLLCGICTVLGIIIGAAAFQTRSSTKSDSVVQTSSCSQTLTDLAFEVACCIKSADFEKLSEYVHPTYGVVISPYATVNLSTNLCFTADEIRDFSDNTQVYTWGLTSDGREPIDMTVANYFQRYVFNYDYTTAQIIGVNYIIKTGNSLENVTDVFPGAQFVDLCNPGTSDGESQNWSTLRLVFEYYGDSLMLTAIIHSEYTV